MTLRGLGLCATGLIAICASGAIAADIPVLDGMPVDRFNKMMAVQDTLASVSDKHVARGVYEASTLWPAQYRKLNVCFFGGSEEARRLIASKAMDWMRPDMAISLDFGKSGIRTCKTDGKVEMQIRVGFDKQGWWSALGHDSVVEEYNPQTTNSLNLKGLENATEATWNSEFTRAVHHEFGHALGLGHEHQSPKSPCEEEFNWIKIYQLLGGSPNYWPKTQIDFNMRKYSYPDVVASDFDVHAVMLYQFPSDFYKTGEKAKCYIPQQNSEISENERKELARLYPVDVAARAERSEKAKAAFENLWNKVDKAKRARLSFDPMKAVFGRPPAANAVDEE
ncbi:MAG: hypothetical protein AB7F74_20885 [Parvibaculaceae bacterium]